MDGLLAYWRAESASTWQDTSGNGLHGTYPAAPTGLAAAELAGAITPSDGLAVNFGGVGYAQVAHNAAFALARGTIGGYFKFTAAGITAEHYVVAKFGSTNLAGSWGIRVQSNGTLRLFLTDGATQFNVDTALGTIEAGVEYHLMFTWDELGAWLILDGRVVAWSTLWVDGWVANVQPLQFAFRHTTGDQSDVVLDEWFLFDRRLTWEEMDELSEWAAGLGYDPAEMNNVGPVNTVPAIEAAIAAANPGDRILVAAGTYNAVDPTITNSGAKRNPIVIAPANGAVGSVTFTAPNITLSGCRWIVFDRIGFSGGRFLVNGARYCRISRANCTGLNQAMIWNQPGGMFNRWDHLDFNGTPASAGDHPIFYFPSGTAAESRNDLADHCIFRDANSTAYDAEAMAPGTSSNHTNHWLGLTVRNCRFEDWLSDNDLETVSIKSSGLLFLNSSFVLTTPATRSLLLRHGGQPWIEGCWFKNCSAGGINGGTRDGVIIGCRFEDCECNLWQGTVEAEAFYADPPASATGRPNALRVKLIGLTAVDTGSGRGSISVGAPGPGPGTFPVADTEIWEITGTLTFTGGGHTGTVQHVGDAPVPWTAAVEVAANEVGLTASDPLVPDGWR